MQFPPHGALDSSFANLLHTIHICSSFTLELHFTSLPQTNKNNQNFYLLIFHFSALQTFITKHWFAKPSRHLFPCIQLHESISRVHPSTTTPHKSIHREAFTSF